MKWECCADCAFFLTFWFCVFLVYFSSLSSVCSSSFLVYCLLVVSLVVATSAVSCLKSSVRNDLLHVCVKLDIELCSFTGICCVLLMTRETMGMYVYAVSRLSLEVVRLSHTRNLRCSRQTRVISVVQLISLHGILCGTSWYIGFKKLLLLAFFFASDVMQTSCTVYIY